MNKLFYESVDYKIYTNDGLERLNKLNCRALLFCSKKEVYAFYALIDFDKGDPQNGEIVCSQSDLDFDIFIHETKKYYESKNKINT